MANNRTLLNNKISQFILRIDLSKDVDINYLKLTELLKDKYDSYKTELHVNYNVDIEKERVCRKDFIKYILGTSSTATTLKIDSFEKSIIIESTQYENDTIYKQCLQNVITALKSIGENISSRRIGMRYINKFSCPNIMSISKILSPLEAKAIKNAVSKDNIARAMMIHEFQCGTNIIRVQFGVPNKFYPSIINNYDIILDIDVFSSGVENMDEWAEAIKSYNHQAYDTFIKYIKDSFLETLK